MCMCFFYLVDIKWCLVAFSVLGKKAVFSCFYSVLVYNYFSNGHIFVVNNDDGGFYFINF